MDTAQLYLDLASLSIEQGRQDLMIPTASKLTLAATTMA